MWIAFGYILFFKFNISLRFIGSITKLAYLLISFRISDPPCLCQPYTEQPNRLNIQRRHQIGIRFLMYSLYAWGVPMILVIMGGTLDHRDTYFRQNYIPQFGIPDCWLVGTEYSLLSILIHLHFHFFHQIICPR
jgi:hypothetical protein